MGSEGRDFTFSFYYFQKMGSEGGDVIHHYFFLFFLEKWEVKEKWKVKVEMLYIIIFFLKIQNKNIDTKLRFKILLCLK
jgi:hypothetical protein